MRFRKRRCILALIATLSFVYMARTLLLVDQVDRESVKHAELKRPDIPRKPLQDSDDPQPDDNNIGVQNIAQPYEKSSEEQYIPPSTIEGAVLRDTLGNYEPPQTPTLDGPGENGVPVKFEQSEKGMVDKGIREYSFNQYVSDKISLDREIQDLRDTECQYWHYPADLPRASVVLVFHNEGWTTLLRTVHSIINRSPSHLLEEVLLVDDYSDKEHLKERLEQYISNPHLKGKVKLIRHEKREGLISARVNGARQATGDVIVWLDAHCEVGYNWLPPLLTPIAQNRTTVVCPIIDVIDNMDFRAYPQGDGKLARGAFDWEFYYKRVPITEREVNRRTHQSEPYRSPVMAGGLFAMNKDYFFQMGAYDPGLQIWGGENYELSFKVWMCGGQLLWVPCSRVGHVYRIHGRPPYTFPNGTLGMYQQKNYLRVAEVWMDEYKEYIYAKNPRTLSKVDYGDITAQRHFRKDNKCKTFHWFMENVAYDVIKWYPLPPTNLFWGEIRPLDSSNLCLDTMGNSEGGSLGLTHCHGYGGNQMFRLTSTKDLRVADLCITGKSPKLVLYKCNGKSKAKITRDWAYDEITMKLYTKTMKQCLDHRGTMVVMSPCDSRKNTQKWDFREF